MDTGDELKAWLEDKQKEFVGRVEFALKVWQSVDFSYPNKYEVIIKWLAQALKGTQDVPVEQLLQLYELRSQPSLISLESKWQLLEVIINGMSHKLSDGQITMTDLKLIESLINSELNQDALRANCQVLMMAYGILFQCYQKYALDLKPEQTAHEHHGEYIVAHVKHLKEYAQRAQRETDLLAAYDQWVLRPLVELLLHLKLQVTFFEDLAAVEKQYTERLSWKQERQRLGQDDKPLHIRLYCLESAIFNHRYEYSVLGKILEFVLVFNEKDKPEDSLTLAAHALISLRRHDISIDYKEKKKSYLEFVAIQLRTIIGHYKQSHLHQVLRLVCSALELNPLLVEDHVHQITIWLMTTTKQSPEEEQLYSEYLVQLVNVIRRLSRAERFIMQLLKTLRTWLIKFSLPVTVGPESKKKKLDLDNTTTPATSSESDPFLKLIFEKSSSPSFAQNPRHDPYQQLNQTWPSHSAGAAFTKLISQLMTKPSLVIWKTLLHSFGELLVDNGVLKVRRENLDFARELHAAFLSQYLLGTRLAEQVHLYQAEIEQQLDHTGQVLKQFGLCLLAQEHNRRQMNAFLECTERASAFELLLTHYWPDGHKPTERQINLHGFLSPAEWTLIQQRVHNFGKSSCRQRLQRLELQLVESKWLLGASCDACPDALAQIVGPQQLKRLSLQQKQLRVPKAEEEEYTTDAECLELHFMHLIQEFITEAKESKKAKGALLIKLNLDENETSWATIIREHHKKKAYQLPSALELVARLQKLPLNQLAATLKFRLWLVLFALQCDLSADTENQTEAANQVLEQLIDMMHFGQPLPICTHLPVMREMLERIATSTSIGWKFYESLFARCIRRQAPGSENFLTSCIEYLQEQLSASNNKLPTEQCRLLLLAIETVSGASGAQGRRLQQRYLQPLLEIYGQMVTHKFRSKRKDASAYKEFVDLTLGGYATYVTSCINRKTEAAEDEIIDENFRRICKIYIGHSVNYRNAHAIRLLNVALSHRQRLHLDSDEIEFVLSSYWRQLNDDINSKPNVEEETIQTLEPAIKLIIGYKTNENFFLLLKNLSSQMNEIELKSTTNLSNVLTLISLFAKCSLSNIKGAMLNEHFELICVNASLRLPLPSDDSYARHMLLLLKAQRSLAGNRTVPLTGETLDCLLGTMLDVNIKRYLNAGGNWLDFVQLFTAMTENLMVLLRQHNALMSDRAAQMTALCQDLIQAIVCYRCERKQAHDLSETELDGLGELGLKLASVMATMATSQALAVKRVAPFLLIFTIKQMVATERPTTLFEKVKVHLVRICHELIGLCDHRSGHFILRASTEAGARMYESLVKEHQKYHKFRGKV